jgi:transcriptional regulator with XRE-family HTH domain
MPKPEQSLPAISIERLKSRMREMGLNQLSTAKAAHLGEDYVRDLVRGKVKQPSATRLTQLAEALHCSPGYLMGMDPPQSAVVSSPHDERIAQDAQTFMSNAMKEPNPRVFVYIMRSYLEFHISSIITRALPNLDKTDAAALVGSDDLAFTLSSKAIVAHAIGILSDQSRDFAIELENASSAGLAAPDELEGHKELLAAIDALAEGGAGDTEQSLRLRLAIAVMSQAIAVTSTPFDAAILLRAKAEYLVEKAGAEANRG